MRLMVRVQTAPALWQYMGQYDSFPSDPLSAQEWSTQSQQVRPAHQSLLVVTVVPRPRPNENGRTTYIGRAGGPRSALGSSFDNSKGGSRLSKK